MTIYEKWALALSIIAIVVPFVQWIWRRWLIKPELNYYPTGRAFLFTNKSGSYIQIEGVFEALRKPISIKNISLSVVRKKDGASLELRWSSFLNPANQRIMGAVTSISETAHPFRIDADSVTCAFTEFADFYNSSYKTLQPYFDANIEELNKIISEKQNDTDVYTFYSSSAAYKNAIEALHRENFWEISKYEIIMDVEYGSNHKKFKYSFEVSRELTNDLQANMRETIDSCFKDVYNKPYNFKICQVELMVIKD